MGYLQTSGFISVTDLYNVFRGTSPNRLSNYYRGGGLVPTEKRDPVTGYIYSITSPQSAWFTTGSVRIVWKGTDIVNYGSVSASATSYSKNGYTYYRGPFVKNGLFGATYYKIYRAVPNINTGVPSSGLIRLSNFYGAWGPYEKPPKQYAG